MRASSLSSCPCSASSGHQLTCSPYPETWPGRSAADLRASRPCTSVVARASASQFRRNACPSEGRSSSDRSGGQQSQGTSSASPWRREDGIDTLIECFLGHLTHRGALASTK